MLPRVLALALLALVPLPLPAQTGTRAMGYADVFRTVDLRGTDLSADGHWLVYEASRLRFPKWETTSNLFLASADGRITRQLTFSETSDDRGPRWRPGSAELIGFSSVREGGKRQLYLIRAGGGEAWRVTDEADGLGGWAWRPDGSELAYLGGPRGQRQVWHLAGEGAGPSRPLTEHPTPISAFYWGEDGRTLFFLAPDEDDPTRRRRMKDRFDVRLVDEPELPVHLWALDLESRTSQRLTSGAYRVQGVVLSRDGRWAAFRAMPTDRYEDARARELYLVDLRKGAVERLTDNYVAEGTLSFSPDSRLLAIVAPREFRYGRTQHIHVRPVGGGEWRELGGDFDRHAGIDFWSADSRTIYFSAQDGVNRNLFAADVRSGRVHPVTRREGVVDATLHEPSGTVLLRYTDPTAPTDLYLAPIGGLAQQQRWTRLTRLNPWVDSLRLARYEAVRWASADGTEVEGLLVYPFDHDPARRYPLVVQLHGGPASAYLNSFGGTYRTYPHIFAAHGYAILQPNYRGSTGYGEHFQVQIAGDYWPRALEDIMSGVDHLIERGVAHPDSLGMMGWSAGGHWSNWTLVSSDRFRAISTGAGVTNWISLYGQTDTQASREYYLGGDAARQLPNRPWDDFDHWWAESPLKHIGNARTPTLIHFGEKDERIPLPQGQELHMALKKLDVPTEFLIYPGQPHGIQEPRYQLVKMQAELGWFEHWIRGRETWLDWDALLAEADRIVAGAGEPSGSVHARTVGH